MKTITIILLSLFAVMGCKTRDIHYTNFDCFEHKDRFIYLNFYNSSNSTLSIPKISTIINSNFFLVKDYYTVVNDTLKIRLTERDNINISDVKSPKIKIINDSVMLKKGERIQQAFKIDEKFKVITFIDNKKQIILLECK